MGDVLYKRISRKAGSDISLNRRLIWEIRENSISLANGFEVPDVTERRFEGDAASAISAKVLTVPAGLFTYALRIVGTHRPRLERA